MKNKIKIVICILMGLLIVILLINGLINDKKVNDTSTNEIEQQITSEIVDTNTNTTKTTKKSKKVVKTTKKKKSKKSTKKVKLQKVATASYNEYQKYAKNYGNYDTTQMNCLINLWNKESGWNPNDVNKSSGACGIPQAYPCKKIKQVEGSNDWKAQIRWGIKYISYRYKNPCGAWKHFQSKHWY